nr:MAG TPA: hypothetical protein [Microviridae sp.]
MFLVTIILKNVNKFGSYKNFSLSLHHEKGYSTNYHQSSAVCARIDSCLFWCHFFVIMQYVSQCSC